MNKNTYEFESVQLRLQSSEFENIDQESVCSVAIITELGHETIRVDERQFQNLLALMIDSQ